jgi:hypothetical protein
MNSYFNWKLPQNINENQIFNYSGIQMIICNFMSNPQMHQQSFSYFHNDPVLKQPELNVIPMYQDQRSVNGLEPLYQENETFSINGLEPLYQDQVPCFNYSDLRINSPPFTPTSQLNSSPVYSPPCSPVYSPIYYYKFPAEYYLPSP